MRHWNSCQSQTCVKQKKKKIIFSSQTILWCMSLFFLYTQRSHPALMKLPPNQRRLCYSLYLRFAVESISSFFICLWARHGIHFLLPNRRHCRPELCENTWAWFQKYRLLNSSCHRKATCSVPPWKKSWMFLYVFFLRVGFFDNKKVAHALRCLFPSSFTTAFWEINKKKARP